MQRGRNEFGTAKKGESCVRECEGKKKITIHDTQAQKGQRTKDSETIIYCKAISQHLFSVKKVTCVSDVLFLCAILRTFFYFTVIMITVPEKTTRLLDKKTCQMKKSELSSGNVARISLCLPDPFQVYRPGFNRSQVDPEVGCFGGGRFLLGQPVKLLYIDRLRKRKNRLASVP